MTFAIAWVLNLDADLELADPAGFAPSKRQRALTAKQGRCFLEIAQLHAPENVQHVRIEEFEPGTAAICQAWCPTPRAVARAEAMGLSLRAPARGVLQRVNHRSLGADLAGNRYAWSMADLDAALAEPRSRGWLLKRPFGFSGRGSKHIAGPMTVAQRRWAEASMRGYGRGLQVEPFVTIEREFAIHGWVRRCGTVLRGNPTGLLCDESRAWVRTTTDPDWTESEDQLVSAAFEQCAAALIEAGYLGPLSIDAYRFRDADGNRHLQALSDVNARYSMGWFTGMADRQAEWLESIQ